jgi:hypothetical protein
MRDLHEELTALTVEWPATPDIAGAVTARLALGAAEQPRPVRRRRLRAWRPAVAYGLAAVVAAFAVTMAVSSDARSAVLEFLGLKSVRIERREPHAPPPRPGTHGSRLGLGKPAALAEAHRRAPYLRLPAAAGLGDPDAVYLGRSSVALVYDDRPGYARARTTGAALLVQEFPARIGEFIGKAVGSGARLERLTVDGDPAYFITGAHGFAYIHGRNVTFEDQRLAGNTLLLERSDGLVIRVEGDITRDRAVAVARSIGR